MYCWYHIFLKSIWGNTFSSHNISLIYFSDLHCISNMISAIKSAVSFLWQTTCSLNKRLIFNYTFIKRRVHERDITKPSIFQQYSVSHARRDHDFCYACRLCFSRGGNSPAKKSGCLLYTSPSPRDGLLSRM